MFITCPKCNRKLKVPDDAHGRTLNCPACKSKIAIANKPPKAVEPPPPAPAPKPPQKPLFDDDDFNFKPAPPPTPQVSLDSIGLSEPVSDPIGRAFHNYDPTKDQPISQNEPSRSLPSSNLPTSRRYVALTIVRYALIILAILEGIGWLIASASMVIALFMSSKADNAGATAFVAIMYVAATFFGGAIVCCLLVAGSELIKLAMDIQSNTLEAARARR